jgi:hypothetical protein
MPETDPIRVFARDGQWVIDYGSYAHGHHLTLSEAIETARRAARDEGRELVVEAAGLAARGGRATRNQFLYRAVNAHLRPNDDVESYVIACECADPGCVEPLSIRAADYVSLRSHPCRFAVLAGHVYPKLEKIVAEYGAFLIVETLEGDREVPESRH